MTATYYDYDTVILSCSQGRSWKNLTGGDFMEKEFSDILTLQEIKDRTEKYILGTYKRSPVAFLYGQGEFLFDTDNKQYIDFQSGVAVTSLGHGEADIIEAIRNQADRIIHTSNLVYNREQAMLAEVLVRHSFPSKVFFTNSGAEANEAAFKLARLFGQQNKNGATSFLTLENSFHGRTFATMSLTGQTKIHSGFGPIVPNIKYMPPNDIEALEKEIDENGTELCAIFLELIQGESGVHPLNIEYVLAARKLATENNILLVFDEIQTGIGRTGKLFAFEHYGVNPDVMTLAKGLGSGIPIGAALIANKFASIMGAGMHGSTFGGNHIAARAAYETLRILIGREILSNVNAMGEYIMTRLKAMQAKIPVIQEVRGIGLHIGITIDRPCADIALACLENGLVINCTGTNNLRIVPPLTITLETAAKGLDILEAQLRILK